MKYMTLLLITIFTYSCYNNSVNKINIESKYKSPNLNTIDYIDIYCWCFDFRGNLINNKKINDSIIDITPNLCLTPISVSYKQITTPSFFKKRIINKKLIKKFKKHFFSAKKTNPPVEIDARLVFIIGYQNEEIDTMVYAGQRNMYIPDYGVLEYGFNIDSLLILIGDGFNYSCE